jgi:hypothetical protein
MKKSSRMAIIYLTMIWTFHNLHPRFCWSTNGGTRAFRNLNEVLKECAVVIKSFSRKEEYKIQDEK